MYPAAEWAKSPLLTRDQEVEICQRIEQAEDESRRIIYGFGFYRQEHIALARSSWPSAAQGAFDRVIVDQVAEKPRAAYQEPAPAD